MSSFSYRAEAGDAATTNQTFLPHQIDLLLPESLTRPLWKSLAAELTDKFFPEKLPPLRLTSRPVDVGMMLVDFVSLPWYRTIFTNIGNVVTPEVLPQLELESRPEDVGELISDQLSHAWWTSLIRNVADRVAPEHVSQLELTSEPMNADLQAGNLQLVRWSSVISTPKVFLPDKPKTASAQPVFVKATPANTVSADPSPVQVQASLIQGRLSRSRWREAFLITVAMSEVTYLLVMLFLRR